MMLATIAINCWHDSDAQDPLSQEELILLLLLPHLPMSQISDMFNWQTIANWCSLRISLPTEYDQAVVLSVAIAGEVHASVEHKLQILAMNLADLFLSVSLWKSVSTKLALTLPFYFCGDACR
jgi:hypothetical protein